MLALARKYRPRTFASVAVQSHVSNTLKGAIARGRVAHGYLLCGPRGVGKTTLARVLAMALNCDRRRPVGDGDSSPDAGEPCGECSSCVRIWSGAASLDVVEIDAASNRGVDDARELRERAMYAPSGDDRYKVYIVDEAHMLTREAWNALLKILEEPPPRVVFVFATTEPQKIAQAAAPVLSRLQRFDFKRIGPSEIRDRLASVLEAEKIEADADALAMLARAADGSMRDALSLTDQALSLAEGRLTAERVREALGLVAEDEYLAMLDLIAARRAGDVFAATARLVELGVDLGAFLSGLADMLRAQLAVALGATAVEVSDRAKTALLEGRERFAPADLLRMLNAITELEPAFRRSGQQRLLLETLLVRFALLDRAMAIEEVLKGLDGASVERRGSSGEGRGGERGGAASAPAAPAAPAARGAPPRLNDTAAASGELHHASAVRIDQTPPFDGARGADGTGARTTSPPRGGPPRAQDTASGAPPRNHGDAARTTSPRPLDARRSTLDAHPPAINQLAERWGEVTERLRSAGERLLATLLDEVTPSALTGTGLLTVDAETETSKEAVEARRAEVLDAIRAIFPGVERVAVTRAEQAGPPAARRVTEESVRAERLASLRKKDPVLGAAIDTLDLELLD